MDKYNKDGFISGGEIYDKLDRYAQMLVETHSPCKYNFTHKARITYLKQLCTDDYYIGYNWIWKVPFTNIFFVKMYARDRFATKVASSIFKFVGKEKNYCLTMKNKKI